MRAKKTASKHQRVKASKGQSIKNSDTLTLGHSDTITLYGSVKGKRVPSRILEEEIQEAVREGARELHVVAEGQHGIGGRILPRGETITNTPPGAVGQRLGSMGM